MAGFECSNKHRLWFMVVLSGLQLACNIFALALPEYVVGNIPQREAQLWQEEEPKPFLAPKSANSSVKVPTHIGLFESLIDGIRNGSNREGLNGVLGFALISTVASFLTFIYSIQLVWKCGGDDCAQRVKKMSKKLQLLAKTNFSAGVSNVAVAAMVGFSAEDLTGEQYGASFGLTVVGAVFAFAFHFVRVKVKEDEPDQPSHVAPDEEHAVAQT